MKIPKYQVFKDGEALAEEEVFVLRASDLFGVPALYGYAHLIQTTLELDQMRTIFNAQEREFLEHLTEEVQKQADAWQVAGTATVPD